MVSSKLALTCCKLVSNLHSCHVKFVASLRICRATLLQTKIAIWVIFQEQNPSIKEPTAPSDFHPSPALKSARSDVTSKHAHQTGLKAVKNFLQSLGTDFYQMVS
ncbi:hypothetical protein AVEN_20705-1 [Araneus ventricosus]|uniref:Uncharacterized protein n=1 Tax=Araneus ventricosus TaxID=182803 RepID=A0A4Y2HSH2_ARAVE|nr:hypothetical protein AVEN_20705-1 [Araneus ventricosus]